MLQNLNIELLRTFVTIADTGSFKRAGEKLFITQSAVSLKIKKLEEILGKKLLSRRQGRLGGLTEEGGQLIGHAREMLRLNELAILSVIDPVIEGTINLGLTDDFIELHLPLVLARFSSAYPRVRLNVRCGLSQELTLAVQNGTLDAALIKQIPGTGTGRTLLAEPLVWVGSLPEVSKDQPLPLVLFSEGCAYRQQAITALNNAGINWRITFTCAGLAGIQAALIGGMGVSALPKNAVSGLPLCEHPMLPKLGTVELTLIKKDQQISEGALKLIDCIQHCLDHKQEEHIN